MPIVSDIELVRRVQSRASGDVSGVEAIGELYDRHQERIFRYIWSRVSNRFVAEDLTGEVFIRMIAHLPKFQPRQVPFKAWLFRIAHNLIIDHYRSEGLKQSLPLDDFDETILDEDNSAQEFEQKILLDDVWRALHELNPLQQEILVLRFLMGFSLQEVASIVEKTVSAVKMNQYRGLKELRAILAREMSEEWDG